MSSDREEALDGRPAGRRPASGQDKLRRSNLSALLAHVHARGATSRAALTSALGLNRSTIGDLTTQLEVAGLVREETPATPATGTGRPSYVVVPRSQDVTVLAVQLEVDSIRVALVGLGGVVLDRRERRHSRGGHGMAAVLVSVVQLCRELLAAKERAETCLGVGVSVPGVVRASDGLVRFAPNLGWVDEPFTVMLAHELRLEVRGGNDADLGVLAEHLRGAAVGIADAAYLIGAVGIGGGFLVGGEPLRGVGGYAGEVGHLPVNPVGARCRCGSRGCWETEVGEDHLLEAAGRLPGGGPAAVGEVLAAAQSGEGRAADAVLDAAHWTGVGVGAIVNLFNPGVVVLDGVLGQLYQARPRAVMENVRRTALDAPAEEVHLATPALGADASLLGAAELAFAPLLGDPIGAAPAAR